MQTLESILAKQPFFDGLNERFVAIIAGCASNAIYNDSEHLFREGEEATQFFIIRHGRVAIETSTPGNGAMIIETHTEGDVVGWSWLFSPYQWHFDGRAVGLTRVTALDGTCLRGKCEEDPVLGYEFMKRFSNKMMQSLDLARFQLLDIYGTRVEK